ncbi:MAG: glycosyltransferase family 4 protein [Chloroflexi bacterium]|nr:glycosyltransferase family 4 protein [Chloroflexota bacterium]MDA1219314.1 glycosyltransferase family 4 protein [Chloroflexota bacterium]
MRILILSQFYDPEPVVFPHELAVGLVERGHQVSVITAIPNYPHDKIYPGYRMRPWIKEVRDGVTVLRLPLAPDHSRSAKRRMLNYASFMATSSLIGPWINGKFDVMYVWHPPLTLGVSAWIIGMMKRIPFLYGVYDLWPEAVAATGISNNNLLMNGLRKLERFVYRRAAAIAVISPGYQQNLIGKGVSPEKIHVLTHWADDSLFRPVPPKPELADAMGMAGRFNVIFGGNMGLAQALETVIDAAQRLTDYPEIQFVFAGDGMDLPRLEAMVRERNLPNVKFLGRQPYELMPDLYALSDVLLAHYKKDPLFEISVPGKLFAYLACQKPVLMASEGDSARIVESSGAGLTCPAEQPAAMAEAVLKLYRMTPQERATMGAAGRKAVEEKYSRRILIDRHEALLAQICGVPMQAVPAHKS